MKNNIILIIFLILSLFTNVCYAFSQEKIIRLLSSADDEQSAKYTLQIGFDNLEMLPNILLLKNCNPLARDNSIIILTNATYKKLFSKERYMSIMLNQIKNIHLYTAPSEMELDRIFISNVVSYFSYRLDQGALCSLDENYSNANLIITKMKENDLIKNNGLKNSLAKKYENSLKSLKKGNKTPAINQLEAAKNEINAQSGKGIDTTAANILIRYTDNLIAHINSTN
ncbi:MAG: hypothetical protein IKP71_05290 [Candidatus Riflebacteria bacterium]|nr:hypothetical protein [Candidatus Riflebacteria bacterium]